MQFSFFQATVANDSRLRRCPLLCESNERLVSKLLDGMAQRLQAEVNPAWPEGYEETLTDSRKRHESLQLVLRVCV